MLTGWVYHDGNYYYMKSWGGMAHDEWILHDKNWYYFKSWGGMYHDQWLTLNGSQYISAAGAEDIRTAPLRSMENSTNSMLPDAESRKDGSTSENTAVTAKQTVL